MSSEAATPTPTPDAQEQQGQARRLKGKDVGLPVRKMDLTYDDDLPLAWFADNELVSMFLTTFSATLPEGESHFIHSVRLFQDKITDPVLKAQIRAFIGQEGHHSREHDTFNNAMRDKGVDITKVEKRMAAAVRRWKKRSPKYQLAHTVCAEHFTALLADLLLSKRPDLLEQMTPQARTIWGWHAIEEAEHKAVAFDVYDQTVGDRRYLRRVMVGVTLEFLLINARGALTLFRGTGQMTNWKQWKELFALARTIGRETWADYKSFYRLDFHPWQHDNREALEKAKSEYLSADHASA